MNQPVLIYNSLMNPIFNFTEGKARSSRSEIASELFDARIISDT